MYRQINETIHSRLLIANKYRYLRPEKITVHLPLHNRKYKIQKYYRIFNGFGKRVTIYLQVYMDDIKLYAKNEQDIDSLIHLTRVFSSDIGMTFGLAKCGRLFVNRGKVKNTCGISLPEVQIDDIDESYKCLGILQSFGNNYEEVRCKATSEYRNRVSKLSSKNKVTAINTFAVPVIRYPAAVVSWRRERLERSRHRDKEAHNHACCVPSQVKHS